jgi:hypothetical protein
MDEPAPMDTDPPGTGEPDAAFICRGCGPQCAVAARQRCGAALPATGLHPARMRTPLAREPQTDGSRTHARLRSPAHASARPRRSLHELAELDCACTACTTCARRMLAQQLQPGGGAGPNAAAAAAAAAHAAAAVEYKPGDAVLYRAHCGGAVELVRATVEEVDRSVTPPQVGARVGAVVKASGRINGSCPPHTTRRPAAAPRVT